MSKIDKAQDGFHKLIEVGRPDLSVEALALRDEFKTLFSEGEIKEAKRRLSSVPSYAWRKAVDSGENFSGEISKDEIFSEGATKQVTVNVFERSQKARKACIEKHGYKCKVCEIFFEDVYGDIGKHFIHIHHLKPLAGISGKYELNPIKDLVPVCPNCHSMLHSFDPPLTIDELKERMKI